MRIFFSILPTVLLVVFGQIVTKWRVGLLKPHIEASVTIADRLWIYLKDPWVLSAYSASFLASILWIFVVESLDVSIAFPLYIGLVVCFVSLGGVFIFGEAVSWMRVFAIGFIALGVILGSRN